MKAFSCEKCGKREKSSPCALCPKRFRKKLNLKIHLKRHAVIEIDKNINPSTKKEKKLPPESEIQTQELIPANIDSSKKKAANYTKITDDAKGTNTKIQKGEIMEDEQTGSNKTTIKDENPTEPIKIFKIPDISIDCEFCEENIGSDYNYRHHLKIHKLVSFNKEQTNEEKTELCELCDYRYRYKITKERNSIYHQHFKTFHNVSKKLKKNEECYICHLQNVGSDPENGAGIYFYTNEGLRIHMRRQHETEDWKYHCYTCNAKFKNPLGLKYHFKFFHYRKHV